MPSRPSRFMGLPRWHQWIASIFSPSVVVQESPRDLQTGDAIWQVRFADGELNWIRVTREALHLPEDEFEELTSTLGAMSWIHRFPDMPFRSLRIHADGRAEKLDSQPKNA